MTLKNFKTLLMTPIGLGALVALGNVARAQTVPAQTRDKPQQSPAELRLGEVVVTGTLIRGVAPIGTHVVHISREQVQATGATTTAQLLQTIPQMGSFNNFIQPAGAFNNVTTNRPNLRDLPGFNTAGGSSTLVLVNGRRVVGMGVLSTSPDPDIVPPDMIERVEIVPDGGSAIYGSDAVAGVINFITRKRFEGVQADAQYGTADHYNTDVANLMAGHEWQSGSAIVAFNYARHSDLTGGDLGYVRTPFNSYAGLSYPALSLECSPGNVQLLAGEYLTPAFTLASRPPTVSALPFPAVPNTANQCDPSKGAGVYPAEARYSVYGTVRQNLSSRVTFELDAFYMNRRNYLPLYGSAGYPDSTLIGPPPFGTPSPFQSSNRSYPGDVFELQQVYFDLPTPLEAQHIKLGTWGVTPAVRVDLGGGWELRAHFSYGESNTTNLVAQADTTALAVATATGLFNPYDPLSSSPAALTAIDNYETYGFAHQSQENARVVADGGLFRLPGGDVKLAAGLEYDHEEFQSRNGTIVPGTQSTGFAGIAIGGVPIVAPYAPLPLVSLGRHISSVFAEVDVPIVGAGNRLPGIDALLLSVSGRYDHYSDFGGTTNPKIGVTFKPIHWFKLRGSWGKSFVAPSLADNAATTLTTANIAPTSIPFLVPPASLIASGRYPAPAAGQSNVIVLLGNHPNIQSETAQTYSIGFDVDPPFVSGLRLGVTYWHLLFNGVIDVPNFTDQADFWGNFGPLITVDPTVAQVAAAEAQANAVVGGGTPQSIYAILDARKNNTGDYRLDGLDFDVNYVHPMSWGAVELGTNADYELHREQSPFANTPFAAVPNVPSLRARVTVGANIRHFTAQAILNHTSGYGLNAPVGVLPVQTHVSGYSTIDLFFKYELSGTGFLQPLSLTLNVQNVLDKSPPDYEAQTLVLATSGYANGATIGRLIELGISKKF